jgi:hypothetical protein
VANIILGKTGMSINRAYLAGRDAARDSVDIKCNPFARFAELQLHFAWRDGYLHGNPPRYKLTRPK